MYYPERLVIFCDYVPNYNLYNDTNNNTDNLNNININNIDNVNNINNTSEFNDRKSNTTGRGDRIINDNLKTNRIFIDESEFTKHVKNPNTTYITEYGKVVSKYDKLDIGSFPIDGSVAVALQIYNAWDNNFPDEGNYIVNTINGKIIMHDYIAELLDLINDNKSIVKKLESGFTINEMKKAEMNINYTSNNAHTIKLGSGNYDLKTIILLLLLVLIIVSILVLLLYFIKHSYFNDTKINR